jgi:DNA polymerase-1
VIQGSAADLIKKAMIAIHRRLKSQDFQARMLLQIHDELVFEVNAQRVEPLARMINDEMTGALPLEGVPLKIDLGIGPNWLDLEPLEMGVAQS